ncbi:MAG: hypothetical protein K8T10_05220 [Candidatus Eremiobacteraeota bacterium]|nr:hypothetical protein [Candidatus Eremiobacteraeota bacterium]
MKTSITKKLKTRILFIFVIVLFFILYIYFINFPIKKKLVIPTSVNFLKRGIKQRLSSDRNIKKSKSAEDYLIKFLEKKKKSKYSQSDIEKISITSKFRHLEPFFFERMDIETPHQISQKKVTVIKHTVFGLVGKANCLWEYYKIYDSDKNLIITNYGDDYRLNSIIFNNIINKIETKFNLNDKNYKNYLKLYIYLTFDSDQGVNPIIVFDEKDKEAIKEIVSRYFSRHIELRNTSDSKKLYFYNRVFPEYIVKSPGILGIKFFVFSRETHVLFKYNLLITKKGRIIDVNREVVNVKK